MKNAKNKPRADKKRPAKEETQNRVWIEFEVHSTDHALNHARAAAATRMIVRLIGDVGRAVWYSETDRRYNMTLDASGTYSPMKDGGYWFNLDYLGRE